MSTLLIVYLTIFSACDCNEAGSSSTSCSSSGDCSCKTGYLGQKCSDCLPGYHKSGTDCLGKILWLVLTYIWKSFNYVSNAKILYYLVLFFVIS